MASWDQIRNDVRSFRASVQPTVTTIRDFSFDSHNDRIFFIANDLSKSSKSPMLFRVDLPKSYSDKASSSSTDSDLDSDLEDLSSDHHSTTGLDHEDHDMGLIPFDPATYQHFAIPSATPIQIITGGSGPRNPYAAAPDRNSFSSGSQPTASGNAATATNCGVPESGSSITDQILAAAPVLSWVPVLSEEWIKYSNSALGHSPTDRLSFYQFESHVNRLMFPYGSTIYTGSIQEVTQTIPVHHSIPFFFPILQCPPYYNCIMSHWIQKTRKNTNDNEFAPFSHDIGRQVRATGSTDSTPIFSLQSE